MIVVAADLARRWESAAVPPLRAARRALKPPLLGVAEADRVLAPGRRMRAR